MIPRRRLKAVSTTALAEWQLWHVRSLDRAWKRIERSVYINIRCMLRNDRYVSFLQRLRRIVDRLGRDLIFLLHDATILRLQSRYGHRNQRNDRLSSSDGQTNKLSDLGNCG